MRVTDELFHGTETSAVDREGQLLTAENFCLGLIRPVDGMCVSMALPETGGSHSLLGIPGLTLQLELMATTSMEEGIKAQDKPRREKAIHELTE